MPTMTRLPAGSNLPHGVVDDEMRLPLPNGSAHSSSSIISPLSLPRGAAGYFDISTPSLSSHPTSLRYKMATSGIPSLRETNAHSAYSPLSPNVRGPALPQFLSPHLSPTTKEVQDQLEQARSTSLPPSYRRAIPAGGRTQTGITLSPAGLNGASQIPNHSLSPIGDLPPISSVSAGPPRSVSADAATAPSHVQMIRRLVQQNGRIREAWEAERKYMEANRERAEEVYKEERALMEEERDEWEAEKAGLFQEIERLQQLVWSLGGDPRRPSNGGFVHPPTSFGPGQPLRGGGPTEASPESMRSSRSSQGSGQQGHRNQNIVWTGTLPDFESGSGLGTQTQLPSSNEVTSPTDSAQAPEADAGPVPIVDIQEIHPELEGIPIKAPAVQRETFTDEPSQNPSTSSSRAASPSTNPTRPRVASQVPSEQTLQVLAAAEHDRLTMHAGHTPNHSLSQLPTISTATTTASSSGDSTPTMSQADGPGSQGLATIAEVDSSLESSQLASEGPKSAFNTEEYSFDPEPKFETSQDPELKGPLMVRNMPAHDEIFFRKLSEKLEDVQKDTDAALPAVLKDSSPQPALPQPVHPVVQSFVPDESTAARDSGSEKESSSRGSGDEELDIPLKIKRSFNFGAPFGEFR